MITGQKDENTALIFSFQILTMALLDCFVKQCGRLGRMQKVIL